MKINFGCGDKKLEGYINVDEVGEPDVKCDLSHYPWPFDTDSADEVLSEHFLEHVIDFEKTILEMHRILKPGGILHFKVPHFRNYMFPWHLHHYQFSTKTCDLLCEKIPYQFGGRKLFERVALRLNYPWAGPVFRRLYSFFANLSPGRWDYHGLTIDEIEFWARKVSA